MEYKFTSSQRGQCSLSEEKFETAQIRKRHFVVGSKLDADNQFVSDDSEGVKSTEVNQED